MALVALIGLSLFLSLLIKRLRKRNIKFLLGPPSKSWLVGNTPDFQRAQNAGEADFAWTKEYGHAFRIKAFFGEDVLYISDPKAIQHVLNKGGYRYPKTNEARLRLQVIFGYESIPATDGDQHGRQRRIMGPAFSAGALKELLPLFTGFAQKLSMKWKELLQQQPNRSSTFNVLLWLGWVTLDVIGAAVFDYKFNSLERHGTALTDISENMLTNVNFMLPNSTMIIRRIMAFMPLWLGRYMIYLPGFQHLRKFRETLEASARVILSYDGLAKTGNSGEEKEGKDLMSLLIKSNTSESAKRRLPKNEILSQVTALIFAGHETSASTLTWALYELSHDSESQERIRREIETLRTNVLRRGDTEPLISDLEDMEFTLAVIKETLRLHPINFHLFRKAAEDDIVPLLFPQKTVSGEIITSIPVGQGQAVAISICAYNRLEVLWGEDANEWRPSRHLNDRLQISRETISLGLVGNLATFSSGIRGCIGWRFAMLEMQIILIHLLEKFSFSPPDHGDIEIRRVWAVILQPMVKGQEEKGTQMPLRVSVL